MDTVHVYPSDLLTAEIDQARPTVQRGWKPAVALLIGIVWGLGTGFSQLAGEYTGSTLVVQGASLLAAALAFFLVSFRWPTLWAGSLCGLMVLLHVLAALISGVVSQDPMWSPIVRYVLLLPAISMFMGAVSAGPKVVRGLQAGLTLSIVAFSVYYLTFVDMALLGRAQYRLDGFLNPNSVGFIAAMGAVSLLDIGLRRLGERGKRLSLVTCAAFAAIAVCLVLCVATKSRTATVVAMAGMSVRLYLAMGLTRSFVLIVLGLLGALVAWEATSRFGADVADMYQLFDRRRGVVTGTGRFHAWYHVIHSVWLPNFVLGVGPGLQGELLKAASGIAMAHNGILMNLAETGLVGTIPLLVILAASFRSCIRRRRNRNVHFAIALFAAGFLESLAENMMFSMGNPGSLLFLLSIAVLCMPEREAVAFAPPVDAAPADEAQWQTVGW